MLRKYPKSNYGNLLRTSAKVLFVTEFLAFAGLYYVWHRLNTSKDYRKSMFENHRWVVEGYYKVGSLVGDDRVKREDYKTWGISD